MGSTASYSAVIDFGPLVGANGDAYSGHNEDGFHVSVSSGNWSEAHAFGNPIPDIFLGPIGSPTPGTLVLSQLGGGTFTFSGFDASANTAVGAWSFEGFLSSGSVYSLSGAMSTGFHTYSGAAGAIDELRITFTPGANTTSMNIDNIVVDAATGVPDGGNAALLLSATFGGMLFMARRRFRGSK